MTTRFVLMWIVALILVSCATVNDSGQMLNLLCENGKIYTPKGCVKP